jgi:hypothetical protein
VVLVVLVVAVVNNQVPVAPGLLVRVIMVVTVDLTAVAVPLVAVAVALERLVLQ